MLVKHIFDCFYVNLSASSITQGNKFSIPIDSNPDKLNQVADELGIEGFVTVVGDVCHWAVFEKAGEFILFIVNKSICREELFPPDVENLLERLQKK